MKSGERDGGEGTWEGAEGKADVAKRCRERGKRRHKIKRKPFRLSSRGERRKKKGMAFDAAGFVT